MSQEIRKRIDELYAQIEELHNPSSFVLNQPICDLNREIHELQEQCQHEYLNGLCRFCDKEER